MDKIKIRGLKIFAHHGVYDFETEQGQTFVVNATLCSDLRRAGQTDELAQSTDYGAVCKFLTEFLQQNTFQLIEAAAEQTLRALLLEFPLMRAAELELCKPEAPIGLPFENVSVTLRRGWTTAYLAFGSNLGQPDEQIDRGLEALERDPAVHLMRRSDTITTEPYGGVEQPSFRNGVVEIETLLAPLELLELLHQIEASQGRDRGKAVRWGPRPLDLDIISYGDEVWNTTGLTLPHPDMQNRFFVLRPLVQIAPHWYHPLLRRTAAELLAALEAKQE
ncbi:MAG: 2-amino-4-hydroxy-6-hydroxymethyldihydropteridine diphosphokinase [Oscillospiraceae bacterium]|nr:2-amino-4-hydroxy-6-hydroxymethyldihydropteridine diphosphokinase [Oscillospiraceae bacterium]